MKPGGYREWARNKAREKLDVDKEKYRQEDIERRERERKSKEAMKHIYEDGKFAEKLRAVKERNLRIEAESKAEKENKLKQKFEINLGKGSEGKGKSQERSIWTKIFPAKNK